VFNRLHLIGFDPDIPLQYPWIDTPTAILLGLALGLLILMLLAAQILKRQSENLIDKTTVRGFERRVIAWLTMCLLLTSALIFSSVVTVIFFGIVSFWALREFITMTPTRRADHRTLFWVIFLFTPLQYVLIAFDLYYFYTIVIPVYGSLFIAARIAFSGDHKRYLERIAKIQFGLLLCVYALSHAPALLYLKLQTFDSTADTWRPWDGSPAGLLMYFVLLVQLSDMFQFVWDRLAGRNVIAPDVNATRTWEGLIGSACFTAIVGMFIQWVLPVTPFTISGAGCLGLVIATMAASGSMTMSAIKRDRGIKETGTLVQGHRGILDLIDAVCFAAPIFFHITRIFLHVDMHAK
jgi:phosphatidate cytidylyltransferase